jgi:fructose-specific phosphotransferase system component IIB
MLRIQWMASGEELQLSPEDFLEATATISVADARTHRNRFFPTLTVKVIET